ncbi:MAG: polysaccharide biosynthesis/export family protein [Polyangiales bacterium]
MRKHKRGLQLSSGVVLLAAITSCAHLGGFVWVDEVPQAEFNPKANEGSLIGVGDLDNVRVFNQEAMSTRSRVRRDGRIAMPLVGDVEVVGKRPADVAKQLEVRLKDFVVAPAVTILVEESQPLLVSVIGEVTHPGVFSLESSAGVLQALASAGGTTEYADRSRIFVLRKSPPMRVRFTYDDLTHGVGKGQLFSLYAGDVVVVE